MAEDISKLYKAFGIACSKSGVSSLKNDLSNFDPLFKYRQALKAFERQLIGCGKINLEWYSLPSFLKDSSYYLEAKSIFDEFRRL